MTVSRADVRHIASLARLGVNEDQVIALEGELNSILEHMSILSRVDTDGVQPAIGVGARGLPVRGDHGPAIGCDRDVSAIAPQMRDGFFLVPRLASHETAPES